MNPIGINPAVCLSGAPNPNRIALRPGPLLYAGNMEDQAAMAAAARFCLVDNDTGYALGTLALTPNHSDFGTLEALLGQGRFYGDFNVASRNHLLRLARFGTTIARLRPAFIRAGKLLAMQRGC